MTSVAPTTTESLTHISDESLRLLPEHMRAAARLYVEEGRAEDAFIVAVASNDLRRSFELADTTNAERMHDWVRFFYAYAPSNAWGSREAVTRWMAMGGLHGLFGNRRATEVAESGA
jgi:hypothetical protein